MIVVTDGERIQGIGDQGAVGLGTSIGRLSLNTLIGGIAPERTVPIVLNLGTNHQQLLRDLDCLGWRRDDRPTFNNDIQGSSTGAAGAPLRALRQQRRRAPEYGSIRRLETGQLAATQ